MKIFLVLIVILSSFVTHAQLEIGVVNRIEHDSLIHATGYRYIVESTARLLSPSVSDEIFNNNLDKVARLKSTVLATNVFIPGNLKVVGPDVNEEAVLAYVNAIFTRAKAANIRMIVWGSGGSRAIPSGFDRAKAKLQFIEMARKVASLASEYGIVLALENLNRSEVNFINTLEEALDVVRQVAHPNLRLCADIYHMLKEAEPPASIEKADAYIVYAEVAEKENRTPPGSNGDDFTPYLHALRNIGYNGPFVIECRWNDFAQEAGPALFALKRQLENVYK